jgi:signal transduction histidine kinase
MVPGERRPKRRLPGYDVEFTKKKIEEFTTSILSERARIEETASKDLQGLTHDMRALSSEIYNAAELVKSDIEAKQYAAALFRTETVIAAQQILSIRLDIIDFSTGQFLEQSPDKIPVYKKVHKVVNCLKPKCIGTNKRITFQGPSDGRTYGPPIFELIPYVIIQNAIKYSPGGSEVVVKVSDFLGRVDLHVQSLGPKIRASEIERIFERGVRGIEAQSSGETGSGIGLYAAKTLVQQGFGGSISASQDTHPAFINDQEFFRTTFSVRVPRVA